MWYTEEEIIIAYREALNKRNQIKILAELNQTTEAEIAEIVGASPNVRKPKRQNRPATQILTDNWDEALNLRKSGASYPVIAQKYKISISSVQHYFNRMEKAQ